MTSDMRRSCGWTARRIDPDFTAVHAQLLLPDRYATLHFLDHVAAGLVRLVPMPPPPGHPDARLLHGNPTPPVAGREATGPTAPPPPGTASAQPRLPHLLAHGGRERQRHRGLGASDELRVAGKKPHPNRRPRRRVHASRQDSRPQFPVEPVVRPLQIFACLALGDGAGVSVNDTRLRSRTCVLRLRARPARVTPITSGAPAWPR